MDSPGCVAAARDATSVTNDPKSSSSRMLPDRADTCKSESLEESKLLGAVTFRLGASGKECLLSPVAVDFRRLIRGPNTSSDNFVKGIANTDLLHAVVGLYDVSLSEMTPDVLYATVCEKWAQTIVLLRDTQDVLEEHKCRRQRRKKGKRSAAAIPCQGTVTEGDRYEPGEDLQATFAVAYSDSDSDDTEEEKEEEEEEEEEEDGEGSRRKGSDHGAEEDEEEFSKGISTFLKAAEERRRRRLELDAPLDETAVGPENRIVAAVTYERKYMKNGEKVVHVTVISVRRRFRKMGIGKYLLQQVKDPLVVGAYDAVVAHVDNSAVDFFGRYGFSDDVVLNSRWREIAEQFTNCTLMSHLPPYAGQALPDKVLDLDLFSLDQDMKKWKEKNLESYQAQVTCAGRMKAEIIRLRAIVSTQQHLIDELQRRVDGLQQGHLRQDKNLLLLNSLRSTVMQCRDRVPSSQENCADEADDSGDTADDGDSDDKYEGTARLIGGLEQELGRYRLCGAPLSSDDAYCCDAMPDSPGPVTTPGHDSELRRYMVARRQDEVYDHGKDIAIFHQVCEDFTISMRKDPKIKRAYSITSISKALLTSAAVERCSMKRRRCGDNAVTMRAYFCGSQEHPERLLDIMKSGFCEADFTAGDFGRGLYFTRYASTAAHFSVPNKLILAEVVLGRCETMLKKDRTRTCPSPGYDSLLTPGRLLPTKDDSTVIQEYVVFDAAQAMPLFQIDYRLTDPAVGPAE